MRLTLLMLMMVLCGCQEKGSILQPISVGSVNCLLEENIARGMNIDKVGAFLTAEKIEHRWVSKERKIYAIVRDVEQGNMTKASVTVEFVFDPAMSLQSFEVKKMFTGP